MGSRMREAGWASQAPLNYGEEEAMQEDLGPVSKMAPAALGELRTEEARVSGSTQSSQPQLQDAKIQIDEEESGVPAPDAACKVLLAKKVASEQVIVALDRLPRCPPFLMAQYCNASVAVKSQYERHAAIPVLFGHGSPCFTGFRDSGVPALGVWGYGWALVEELLVVLLRLIPLRGVPEAGRGCDTKT